MDGRSRQQTVVDGYEGASEAIQTELGDGRLEGESRPMQAKEIYRRLVRDHG